MRFPTSLWLPAVACLAHAASETGHLMIFPADTWTRAQHKQITPDTARVMLASAMGLDQFHDFGAATQQKLDMINVLQSQSIQPSEPVELILTYGDEALAILDAQKKSSMQQFDITPVPSTKETEQLFEGLVAQDKWMESQSSSDRRQNTFTKFVESDVSELAGRLSRNIAQGNNVYVLNMPSHYKGVKHSTYGSYGLPSTSHSYLHKRANKEIPIEVTFDPISDSSLAALDSRNSSSNTTVLRGILPSCFPSLSVCESMTQNCTGHGSCRLKYTDKDAASGGGGGKCYTCACTADVRTNKDGTKKTTQWGGPACQKKDVVAPFWLLAGFTVGLIFLVSWGIGTLMTMGNEELPSVIGAGVSGVPRR